MLVTSVVVQLVVEAVEAGVSDDDEFEIGAIEAVADGVSDELLDVEVPESTSLVAVVDAGASVVRAPASSVSPPLQDGAQADVAAAAAQTELAYVVSESVHSAALVVEKNNTNDSSSTAVARWFFIL
ncbi:hypothetical protein PRIC1_015141 [Phytophthora ramorum]